LATRLWVDGHGIGWVYPLGVLDLLPLTIGLAVRGHPIGLAPLLRRPFDKLGALPRDPKTGIRRIDSSITCWCIRLNLVTSRRVARPVATPSQQKIPLLAVFDGNPPSLTETDSIASR